MSRIETNIKDIYRKYREKLDLLDINLIISFVLKKPIEFTLAFPETKLNTNQLDKINVLMKRRLKGEPMAYILGYKEFYGLKFRVNKNVLVPRPETEMIVEEVINCAQNNTIIIDMGTGSGCIIIALAKLLKSKKIKFITVDISKKALNTAKQNAKLNKVNNKINFINGDLLKPIINNKKINNNSKIIITANLPYLTPKQIKNSPSIKKEPRIALVAGSDGLKYYRQLFQQIKKLTAKEITILCEIDPSQKKTISILAKKIIPKANIKIKKDLSGLSRLAIIKM